MTAAKFDVYTHVTSQIVAQIVARPPPWCKPWTGHWGSASLPERFDSEAYREINILVLWATAMVKDYSSARWMTFNQAQHLGGHVRKSDKSATVVKYGAVKRDDENGEEWQIPYPSRPQNQRLRCVRIPRQNAGSSGTFSPRLRPPSVP